MNVLLIEDDDDFRKRFSDYLAAGLNGIVLTSVSSLSQLDEGIAGDADVILIAEEPQAVEQLKRSGLTDRTVVLDSRSETEFFVRSDGIRCVNKYQRASAIISSVAELSDAAVSTPSRRTGGSMEKICVTGFAGGCGRTSLSLMYARMLKRNKSRNPVILPVGRFGNLNEYFRNCHLKSDLNLLLLNLTSGFKVTPQRFLAEDDFGVSAFVMPDTACDMVDLSREEVNQLIEEVQSWGFFDSLILDVNPQSDPVSRSFIQAADKVLILHDQKRGIRRAERAWMDQLHEMKGRDIFHVMNNAAANLLNGEIYLDEQNDSQEFPELICRIPEDSGSFFFRDGIREISLSGHFAGCAAEIAERIGNGWKSND